MVAAFIVSELLKQNQRDEGRWEGGCWVGLVKLHPSTEIRIKQIQWSFLLI